MLKGMFVNCWGCHLTTKLDDRNQDWHKLDIIDKGELICNADFCSRAHLNSWLNNDLIPLLVQEVFDEATGETPRKSNFGAIISGAVFSNFCVTCDKKGPFRLELVIYHNKTIESKGFCSLDCLKTEEITISV